MDSPNANIDEKTLNFPQPEPYTKPPNEPPGGLLTFCPGGGNGGSSDRLWSMCLAETENKDKEMAEMWKGEADTALIFYSIIESYKWLSSDPGDQTVSLLDQISRQLVNISRGVPLEDVIPISTVSESFKPNGSALLVNVTWFCCMVICFSCSVAATITQQCARRYLLLTQGHGTPYERAQLRMFMFHGLGIFRVDDVLLFLSMALHVSILLYCVGIVGFIFRVYKHIGFIAVGILSMTVLIYAIFTVLPIFCMNSPMATPFTNLVWRLYHFSLLGFFATIRGIFRTFSADWPRTPRDVSGSRRPAKWLEERVNMHRQRCWNGLRGTLELNATERPPAQVGVTALQVEKTFTALVESDSDKKIEDQVEDIAAWVPEFFNAYTPPEASEADPPLMFDQPPTTLNFGSRLHHLLKTCISGTSNPDEGMRNKHLEACLKCLWCWVKAYTSNQNSAVPLPSHFPLPSPDTIRRLQAEQDPTAGMIGRCFGALVAKKLAADVNSHHSDVRSRDAKLESLSAILGTTSTVVETLLSHPGAIGLANIVALTSSGTDTLVMEKVPSEVLGIFQTTVRILVTEVFLASPVAELPPDLVASFHETYSNAQRLQVPNWLMDQLMPISQKLSGVTFEPA
ncbi:hypothetical protein EDB92DRAFT_1893193 [Lactarius akahatsu]|uniref:DUF6535 domain-containing protein n=1 Tax=Lactarius akahatsu TaxID=416441 RepID=A0AAD4LC80_9AGAM|nr:hypothetical protein EDB92DRAFT_1893193 [Lactarius akahatsu]